MTDTKPRDPLPPDVITNLLDPAERELVIQSLLNARRVCPEDGTVNLALARAYAEICNLHWLVDELRPEIAGLREDNGKLMAWNCRLLRRSIDCLEIEDKANRLEAENQHLLATIADVQRIDADLRRRGIEIAELPALVRRAREGQGRARG